MRTTLITTILLLLLSTTISCQSNNQHKSIGEEEQVIFFDKPLEKGPTLDLINQRLSEIPRGTMDIQHGGPSDGWPVKFMVSYRLGKDTAITSTGHLSCYSVIFDMGSEYFVLHTDADNVTPGTEAYRLQDSIIKARLEGETPRKVLIGASHYSPSKPDHFYINRMAVVKSLIPDGVTSSFFCGPNAKEHTKEEIIQSGVMSPDALITTDITYHDGFIVVARPPNSELMNQGFDMENYELMLKKYRQEAEKKY